MARNEKPVVECGLRGRYVLEKEEIPKYAAGENFLHISPIAFMRIVLNNFLKCNFSTYAEARSYVK